MGMNSMFANFTNNLDTTFQPNSFQPNYNNFQNNQIKRVEMNKPYEILNADKSLKGYFWYYGNSVDLCFMIEDATCTLVSQDQYIDMLDILPQLNFTATIYDFRLEPIVEFSTGYDAKNKLNINITDRTVIMQIDNLLSQKLVKGKYYISLDAIHPSGYHETLFSVDTCDFEVR